MDGDKVVLLDFWPSPFGLRVRIVLAEKGVEYEQVEEDLLAKSPLLLSSNPVYKKIPVLIHKGKPICDSLVILEYIDETWKSSNPLLPQDPQQRANMRFWADFINQKGGNNRFTESPMLICMALDEIMKCTLPQYPSSKMYKPMQHFWFLGSIGGLNCTLLIDGSTPRVRRSKGEAQVAAKKEFIGYLKLLEGELGEKLYFGGNAFGYLDIALISFSVWFYTYETLASFSVAEECPKLMAWVKRCWEREAVSKVLPDPHKVYEYACTLKKKLETELVL